MRTYRLVKEDESYIDLNGTLTPATARNTMTYENEENSWVNRLVERSFLPGSVKVGDSRLGTKSLILTYQRVEKETLEDSENELLSYLQDVKYLVDTDRELRIEVAPASHVFTYDLGSHKISGVGEINLTCIKPYWEDIEAVSVTGTSAVGDVTDVSISNDGYMKTYPIITLEASSACSRVQVYVESTQEGFDVQDSDFGIGGNLELVIDCEEGTLELEGVSVLESLSLGTGFISFPPGDFTLSILSTVALDYTIEYRERYFL